MRGGWGGEGGGARTELVCLVSGQICVHPLICYRPSLVRLLPVRKDGTTKNDNEKRARERAERGGGGRGMGQRRCEYPVLT